MPHDLVVNIKVSGCDVYVGRPTKWGNPYMMLHESDRDNVLRLCKKWLLSQPDLVAAAKEELKGKILGCYCAPKLCHADFLAEIANS